MKLYLSITFVYVLGMALGLTVGQQLFSTPQHSELEQALKTADSTLLELSKQQVYEALKNVIIKESVKRGQLAYDWNQIDSQFVQIVPDMAAYCFSHHDPAPYFQFDQQTSVNLNCSELPLQIHAWEVDTMYVRLYHGQQQFMYKRVGPCFFE